MEYKINLEAIYQQYISDLKTFAPEDIIDLNLNLIHSLGFLNCLIEQHNETSFKKTFKILETKNKVTLHNKQFIIWMTPQRISSKFSTIVMIASISDNTPNLELIFSASGVYNNSYIILKTIESLLYDIAENNLLIEKLML